MAFTTLDFSIIAFYFLIVIALGFYLSRNESELTQDDYFTAGRKLGWFVIGSSLFASNISSEHLIGLSADGFRTGLAVGNYEWGATIVLIVLAVVFVPFYVGHKIQTLPEFLQKRFGLAARMYLSIVTLVANVLVRISVALYAGGLVLESMFGINMWIAITFLALVTVFYTAVGGLKAVVYTDVVQAIILLVGTAYLSIELLTRVGGWEGLQSSLNASYFDMVKPASDPEMPWPGLVLGVPILGIWYWCTDQVIVQRVLGAKDVHNARMGALFAAVLKILPVFLFVLPGLCGRVLFPEVDSKAIFPHLIEHVLPMGLKGLVSAALIAALMSSIDSTLNSTGTLVSIDFFKRLRPDISHQKLIFIGRVTTIVVMIFGILWVNVVMQAESLFQYLQQVQAAISPPIAVVFLMGIFWKRANHQGALWALVGGLLIGIGQLLFNPMPFLIAAGITFFLSIGLMVLGSLLSEAPAIEQTRGLTWSDADSHVGASVTTLQKNAFRVTVTGIIFTMIILWSHFS